jgi:broad specificity phosphatase PhoE
VSITRLTVVSHGMTAALRAARFPLDESVEARALDAARAVNLPAPDHAVTDGSARCQQTADALGLHVAVDDRLADLDTGRWRGLGLDEVDPADLAAWTTDPAAALHGGETVLALLERMRSWLAEQPVGRTVAVTHPAVIRAVLVTALAADLASFWRIDVTPLSTTSLHGQGGRWTLRHVNRPL